MPKEADDLKVDTDANLRASEEVSEPTQTEQTEDARGFFAKAIDKAKEATNEFFSTDSSQEAEQTKPTQTPKLKNAINKKTKLIDSLAFQYNGKEDFTLRVGSQVYVIAQGEILIVPNGNTSRWLAHKSTLFTPVI